MCDYSLYELPTRLAVEGEELVVHRFRSGTTGLASPTDLYPSERPLTPAPRDGFWRNIKSFLLGDSSASPQVTAVCIPPGAQLILLSVPENMQRQWSIEEVEGAFFLQTTANVYNYRDALRFRNGIEVLLQNVPAGIRVHVLSLGNASAGSERDRAVPAL